MEGFWAVSKGQAGVTAGAIEEAMARNKARTA